MTSHNDNDLHILACDERGVTRWPSRTRTYTMGGYAVKKSDSALIIDIWNEIKHELCGSSDIELKWMHFFPGDHQQRSENPLVSTNPGVWRRQARWSLSKLFDDANIFPITSIVQKDKTSDDSFTEKPDGRRVLNTSLIWPCTIAQFALYIKERNVERGQVWFDQLGSRVEEERLQNSWIQLLTGPWPVEPQNQKLLRKIDQELKFLDSESEPIIQVADFVSGVIWAASEGDESFLLNFLRSYAPGMRQTYGILFLD